jgi:cytochrome c oxidase subunit II
MAGLAVIGLLAAGCGDGPLSTLHPAGPIARQIDDLWKIVLYLAIAVFIVVEGLLVVALFKFRHRKGDDSEPAQTHGNTRLELGWTIAPAVVLAALAIPTVSTIWALAREPAGALPVTITAHQWWWEYDYGDGAITANELHIPTGRPIRLTLKSADVIHSYWIPKLGGKQDVVPSRTNHLTIQADAPGSFAGTCVEYCGLSHANMRVKAFAHSPADFARWLADQKRDAVAVTGAAAQGKRIFESKQCVSCHAIRGTPAQAKVGPDLTHFGSRTTFAGAIFESTERNLRRWLEDAPAVKPGSKMLSGLKDMGLTQEDITALIAYLQSLK